MVRQRRRRTNRQNSSQLRREITTVRTGVPVSRRRVPRDPPMLPHVVAYPVRVRFIVDYYARSTDTGYVVLLAGTPTGTNIIRSYVNMDSSQSTVQNSTTFVGLTFNQVFVAAAMRLYGVDISLDTQSANFLTTEFAIMKVTAYGSDNRVYQPSTYSLGVDIGGDVPGFYGKDSGNANSRACISFTASRLSWQKITTDSGFSFLSFGVAQVGLLPVSKVNTSFNMGVIDLTVLVRRSVVVQNNALSAAKTAMIDDKGEELYQAGTLATTLAPV